MNKETILAAIKLIKGSDKRVVGNDIHYEIDENNVVFFSDGKGFCGYTSLKTWNELIEEKDG